MIGLPLSESTRAAALDGALSFSILLQNQRELTLNTAQSSVTGLLSAITSAPADYARLLSAAEEALTTQNNSAQNLVSPAWSSADDATRTALSTALHQAVVDATNASLPIPPTIAAADGKAPTTFQLDTNTPPPTYLTTWGDSGVISITDASGHGVFIAADGTVDAMPPSGDGWQFKQDATFLLPDGTKISFSPGSPATVLATRGQQRIEITGLKPEQDPTATRHSSGGLAADAARNDGYIFSMGADQRGWTLEGAPLGGVDGSREVVATAPLDNEYAVDVTNVSLPGTLVAQLQALGIDATAFDTNHDGRFSNAELQQLVAALDAAVGGVQTRFDLTLKNTSAALESLLRLNQFFAKLLAESDRKDADHREAAAAERDQLVQIQRDLDAARNALHTANSPPPESGPKAGVITAAHVVLNQVQHLSTENTSAPKSASDNASPVESDFATTPTALLPDVPVDGLTQALRRAERLLSGLGTGAARFVEATPASDANLPGSVSQTEPESTTANDNGGNPPPLDQKLSVGTKLPPSSPSGPPGKSVTSPEPAAVPITTTQVTESSANDEANRAVSESQIPRSSTPVPPPPTQSPPIEPAPVDPRQTSHADRTELPSSPSGQQPLPGTGFPATGPNPNVAPDPTFGASDGFAREFRRRLDQHETVHREHAARAQQLQTSVREVVEQFLTLVSRDEQLRQVFDADDLSDAQRDAFKGRIEGLERRLGFTWGGDATKTPQGEANLNARVLGSGMMI